MHSREASGMRAMSEASEDASDERWAMRAMSDASDEKPDRVSLQSMPPRLDSDSDSAMYVKETYTWIQHCREGPPTITALRAAVLAGEGPLSDGEGRSEADRSGGAEGP